MSEFEQGEIIEVTDSLENDKWIKAEFIGYTGYASAKYGCWNEAKNYIVMWKYAKGIKPHKNLIKFAKKHPKCQWEYKSNNTNET